MALLELLRREGAAGATVTRGLAGFGARSRIHTATILTLSEDLPIRIEWVDQAEVVERLMPRVRRMVDDGLIVLEEIDVVQYAPGRGSDPLAQPVGDLMRTEVTTVRPETPVAKIVSLLLHRGYRSVPVVDVLRALEYHHLPAEPSRRPGEGSTVADLMYRDVPTVTAGATLEEILQVLEAGSYRRVIVVDEAKRVVGLITDGDLLRRSRQGEHPGLLSRLRNIVTGKQVPTPLLDSGETAADLMTRAVVTVTRDTPLVEALRLMLRHQIKRLPVVDESGQLVGLLGRGNLLRGLLRQNGSAT